MIDTFNTLKAFIKHPDGNALENISIQNKLIIVLKTLVLAFIIAFTLSLFISVLALLGVYDMNEHAINQLFKDHSKLYIALMAVVGAPLIEELIFRAPLTLFKHKKQFNSIFYAFAIVFALMHLFNFKLSLQVILCAPILVAPQFILGLLLGYLRVKLGLVYSILLHMLFNGILLLPNLFLIH